MKKKFKCMVAVTLAAVLLSFTGCGGTSSDNKDSGKKEISVDEKSVSLSVEDIKSAARILAADVEYDLPAKYTFTIDATGKNVKLSTSDNSETILKAWKEKSGADNDSAITLSDFNGTVVGTIQPNGDVKWGSDASNDDSGSTKTSDKDSTPTKKADPTSKPDPTEAPKAAKVTIEEQVLVDEAGVKITATGYEQDDIWGDKIKVIVENSTDKNLTISCNALIVNNYMITDWFYCKVAAGKKAADEIDLSDSSLKAAGIDTIGQIEIFFRAYDSDDWAADSVLDNKYAVIKTSDFDKMDTTPNDSGAELYNKGGIKIVGKYVDEDSFWGSSVLLYIENKSGQNISVHCDDLSVNGFMITEFFSSTVYDGKMAIDEMILSSDDLEKAGIKSIDELECKFRITNPDTYDTIAETDSIKFSAK